MKYAVVCFLDEVVENETVVSEVPLTWLTNNKTLCKWPPNHENFHISKGTMPKENWTSHRVRCERICDTLELARKKCVNTSSSEECGKGLRKKKPVKHLSHYYPNCESPPSFEDVEKSLNRIRQYASAEVDSLENTGYSEPHFNSSEGAPIEPSVTIGMNSLDAEDYIIETIPINITRDALSLTGEKAGDSAPEMVLKDSIVHNNEKSAHSEEKLDKILRLLASIKLDIDELKSTLPMRTNEKGHITIAEFPLDTIEAMKSLDSKLQSDMNFRDNVVQYFKYVGGTSLKDITTRCLKKMITNKLCEKCSWKGWRNNNFKIEDLTIVKCLYDAICSVFQCTEKEFEIMVRDFLRHGKQRREREEKNKHNP